MTSERGKMQDEPPIKTQDQGFMKAEALIREALRAHSTELHLSGLGLTSLPESIGHLSQVQTLDLSDNKLMLLPESVGQLSQLQFLDLSNNKLMLLPESVGQLSQLQILDLWDNDLTSLPISIGQLKRLQFLDLSFNNLMSLRASIARLSQLQTLDLSNNKLTLLPESIGHLSQVQTLDLSGNELTLLPESVGQLSQLQFLDLSNNKLTLLPESVGQLSQLQFLDLSQNKFASLPRSIARLSQVQTLDLSGNELTLLPESIGHLSQVQTLDLSSNELTLLPESIGHLSQVQALDLSGNELTLLPESIGQLKRLQCLHVDGNQLESLPDSIGNLTQLTEINLAGDRLKSLPRTLSNLTLLTKLFLHGNDSLLLPPEVLGLTWHDTINEKAEPAKPSEILKYYFRICAGRQPLNEAKLILIGHGAVGKTSLVNRLVHGTFAIDEKKTEGIKITQWPIRLRDKEEVRLNIWDFGGQEIMHATHQFFLTQRSLYLLVLNGRQGHEDSDAEYWLNLIRSFGEDSPVIVVMNKMREQPFDLNRRGLTLKFPSVRGFIETDCEDGTGIGELRQAIERETDRLEHLRDVFPASWFDIKDRLASMKENYVTFDRYREICAETGESDTGAQEDLAFYLHSLGIALNYKDDPRLRDTHVLNPRWVTNGIYTILNNKSVAEQKGELRVTDLSRILDSVAYPLERHCFLLELMRKFELCFSFPEDDGHYLIPELLDKQLPVEAEQFDPAECLNFEYQYPVLPEGLLPRFIVRSHVLSTGQRRWRTGVILEFEGNKGLVKADVQDKRVSIAVAGPTPGRRRLLAVIRCDFEHIHRTFTFKPQEMIPVPGHPEVLVPYEELLVMERNGLRERPTVIGTKVLQIDLQELLNGVDLEGTRRAVFEPDSSSQAVRLFYSYSHKDEELRYELETHLKLLQRQGLIEPWHDRRITAGEEWRGQIDENLERADIILLLVSADFLASDYCYDIEMRRALERHNAGRARVIPIIVRDVNWQSTPFGQLQALPKDGKAVTTWPNRDTAWRNVAEGIENVVKALRHKSPET